MPYAAPLCWICGRGDRWTLITWTCVDGSRHRREVCGNCGEPSDSPRNLALRDARDTLPRPASARAPSL